jgi:formate/nitrite transporter FocA (FNT family)
VVISLGNVVGGVFLPSVETWKAKLDARTPAAK